MFVIENRVFFFKISFYQFPPQISHSQICWKNIKEKAVWNLYDPCYQDMVILEGAVFALSHAICSVD
jgi:hypothetical protein